MKKILAILLLLCSFLGFSFAEKEVKVYSKSMKKDIPVTVILPDGYSKDKSYNTIYVYMDGQEVTRTILKKHQ